MKGYFVKPENVLEKKNGSDLFDEIMTKCNEAFSQFMCKEIPPEDARVVLPIATPTKDDKTLKVFNAWLTGTFHVIKARSAYYLQLDIGFLI